MADDVLLPGDGSIVKTHEVDGKHVQIMKLSIGGEGVANLIGDDEPLPIRADHETPYGEIFTATARPVIQGSPTYNRLPANWRAITATGGSGTVSNKEFICQTGTSVGGYGVIRSVRSVNYHEGVGIIGRFAARFTAGVALSLQGVGFFNVGDGYLFGYQNDTFGIIHQYGGKPEVRTITVTAGAGGSETLTLTLNDVEYSISITSGTAAHNAFEIAAWLSANQSVWSATQNGSTVVCMALSDGAKSGAYSYVSSGTGTGSVAQTTAGITKTTDFYPKAEWNLNTLSTWDPEFDPTKGQSYSIQYHSIRYGLVEFFVMDQESGRQIPVHRIVGANVGTSVLTNNPSFRIGIFAASLGSTTNLTAAAGSMSAFQAGEVAPIRNPRGYSNVKTAVTTALTSIFTLRSREVYNGEPNQVEIEPLILSAFTESNKGARIVLYAQATLGGEPNFADVETGLVAEVSTAGTTVTPGTPIFDARFTGAQTFNLSDLNIRIPPGIKVTVAMAVNSGAAADCGAGMSWYEDV